MYFKTFFLTICKKSYQNYIRKKKLTVLSEKCHFVAGISCINNAAVFPNKLC